MSERKNHLFQFRSEEIAEAAKKEADYHSARMDYWRGRELEALIRVKKTAKVEVVQHEVSGGLQRYSLHASTGDPGAWEELMLANDKVETHRRELDRFNTDYSTYSTQNRVYELDADDVHHFRLSGQDRPE